MAPRQSKPAEVAPPEPGAPPARMVGKVGNLTKDPELGYSDGGMAYCRTGLAVNVPSIPGDWSSEKVTEFYDVTCFGDLAENVASFMTKGMRAVVCGRGEIEHWDSKSSENMTTKKILAEGMGPDIRWAEVTVNKIGRKGPSSTTVVPAVDDF